MRWGAAGALLTATLLALARVFCEWRKLAAGRRPLLKGYRWAVVAAALVVAGGAAYQAIVPEIADYDGTILVLALLGTMALAALAAEFKADLWAAGRWLWNGVRQKRRSSRTDAAG